MNLKIPVNFPLLTSEPDEQAVICVDSIVNTTAAPGSSTTLDVPS